MAMVVVSTFLWVMVGGASSAATPTPPSEPRKCCIDEQFTATLGDVGAVGTTGNALYFLEGAVKLSYDFYRQTTRTHTELQNPDGSVTVTDELHDYLHGIVYSTAGNGTCTAGPLRPYDFMMDSCVPDEATYLGPAVFGQGLYSLRVNTWSFVLPGNGTGPWEIIMSFTDQHCVPVLQIMNGQVDGAPLEQSLFFTGYRPGIDAHVSFAPPPNCRLSGAIGSVVGR